MLHSHRADSNSARSAARRLMRPARGWPAPKRQGVELELRQGRGDMAGDEVLAIDEVLHQQGRRLLRAEAGLVQARPFGGADDMAVADGPFAGGAQVAGGAIALVGLDEGEADGGGAAQGGGIGHGLSSEGAGSLRTRAR